MHASTVLNTHKLVQTKDHTNRSAFLCQTLYKKAKPSTKKKSNLRYFTFQKRNLTSRTLTTLLETTVKYIYFQEYKSYNCKKMKIKGVSHGPDTTFCLKTILVYYTGSLYVHIVC